MDAVVVLKKSIYHVIVFACRALGSLDLVPKIRDGLKARRMQSSKKYMRFNTVCINLESTGLPESRKIGVLGRKVSDRRFFLIFAILIGIYTPGIDQCDAHSTRCVSNSLVYSSRICMDVFRAKNQAFKQM